MADDERSGGSTRPSASAPVLADDVIRLRALSPADALAWLAGEDEQIRRWFQLDRPSTLADVTGAIEAWTRAWAEGGPTHHFGIEQATDGTVVGGVEARDRGEGRAYLSFQVFAPHRRRGYATRAVRLVCTHALAAMPVTQLVIITDHDNAASRGVAEAAGFVLDGPADPWEHVELGDKLRYVRAT